MDVRLKQPNPTGLEPEVALRNLSQHLHGFNEMSQVQSLANFGGEALGEKMGKVIPGQGL